MLLRLAPWLFVALWSTGYIAIKYAAPFAEPFTFLSIRFLLVVLVITPFILAWGWSTGGSWIGHPWRLSLRDTGAAMLVGALLHGVYLGGIFWAIKQGMPAGVAAVIISLQPLVAATLVAPMLGERVEFRHWIGLLLGFAGVLAVLLPGAMINRDLIGPGMIGMSLLSLAAITVGTSLQKVWFSHIDVRAALLPQYVGAALIMLLGAFLFEDRTVHWSVEAVGAMAWLVLVLSVGAISLFLILLRRNEVWRTVTLFYMMPPFTTLIAWVVFDEQLALLQIAGMGLVVVAMLLARPTMLKRG